MNTRSVKPINVSLTVTILSESQKWKEDQFSEKLSFNSDSSTSVSQPFLKEIIPKMLHKFNQNDYLLIQIKQPRSENEKCLLATIQEAGCPQTPDFLQGERRDTKYTNVAQEIIINFKEISEEPDDED